MQKWTHLVFAVLIFLVFNYALRMPLYFSIFALIGAMAPDLDLSFMHRKLLHNVWAMALMVFAGLAIGLMDKTVAIAFSLGYLSHLAADALTHKGVMPFWPISKPAIRGPIRTGGFGELLLLAGLLFLIYNIGGFLS